MKALRLNKAMTVRPLNTLTTETGGRHHEEDHQNPEIQAQGHGLNRNPDRDTRRIWSPRRNSRRAVQSAGPDRRGIRRMIGNFEHAKWIGDLTSGAVAAATLFAYLPQIAAGLSILWTLYRFGDSFYEKWQARKRDKG